ncbi:hypothetical protein AAG906_017853 [Vitis piasezkii]
MPIEQGEDKVILFTKEQFNAGLAPFTGVVQGISPLLRFHPSSFTPTSSGVDGMQIINMLVQPRPYAIGGRYLRLRLPSLQVVTELPDSTKGGAKGLVLVRGGWAGLSERPSRPFSPNYTLEIPGKGVLVDWVEKASFAVANYSR